jgi:hypothetical protein
METTRSPLFVGLCNCIEAVIFHDLSGRVIRRIDNPSDRKYRQRILSCKGNLFGNGREENRRTYVLFRQFISQNNSVSKNI